MDSKVNRREYVRAFQSKDTFPCILLRTGLDLLTTDIGMEVPTQLV